MGTRTNQDHQAAAAAAAVTAEDDDVAAQSLSMSGSVGSPSSRSEQTTTMAATPASDSTFLRLNHLDIHADDAGSQAAVGKKKKRVCEKVESKGRTTYNEVADELVAEFGEPGDSVTAQLLAERGQRSAGGDKSGRGFRQFCMKVAEFGEPGDSVTAPDQVFVAPENLGDFSSSCFSTSATMTSVTKLYEDCKSKLFIDIESFGKMRDAVFSLENKTSVSRARAIKGNVDKYICYMKQARQDVLNKSLSVEGYELELLLRFENLADRLQKLSTLLDASEIMLGNNMSSLKETSVSIQSAARILETKLNKFLEKYVVAVANFGNGKLMDDNNNNNENQSCEEEECDNGDDWKIVLPNSFAAGTSKKKTKKGKLRKK